MVGACPDHCGIAARNDLCGPARDHLGQGGQVVGGRQALAGAKIRSSSEILPASQLHRSLGQQPCHHGHEREGHHLSGRRGHRLAQPPGDRRPHAHRDREDETGRWPVAQPGHGHQRDQHQVGQQRRAGQPQLEVAGAGDGKQAHERKNCAAPACAHGHGSEPAGTSNWARSRLALVGSRPSRVRRILPPSWLCGFILPTALCYGPFEKGNA